MKQCEFCGLETQETKIVSSPYHNDFEACETCYNLDQIEKIIRVFGFISFPKGQTDLIGAVMSWCAGADMELTREDTENLTKLTKVGV